MSDELHEAARDLCQEAVCADCGQKVRDPDPKIIVQPHDADCRVGRLHAALESMPEGFLGVHENLVHLREMIDKEGIRHWSNGVVERLMAEVQYYRTLHDVEQVQTLMTCPECWHNYHSPRQDPHVCPEERA